MKNQLARLFVLVGVVAFILGLTGSTRLWAQDEKTKREEFGGFVLESSTPDGEEPRGNLVLVQREVDILLVG